MRLHFIEPSSLKNCISVSCIEGCSKIPLFHGTRMYALQVNEEDRKRFYIACDRIVSFAKKLIWNCPVADDKLEEYILTKNPLFLGVVVSQYKTAAYEYGSFYVTTSYPTAITFANNCGGELGQWAYAQCVGFLDFQIDLDTEMRDAVAIVMEEYEKYATSEKVVIVFSNVRLADLQTERGKPFLSYDENGGLDESYNAYMMGMLYETEVTDCSECAYSFRLQKCDTYTTYLIRQKNFKEGIPVFTKVQDVDKYLKWNDSKCLRELI